MSVAVAKQIMFLQNKIEEMEKLQKSRDLEQGKDPNKSARDRLAAARD